MWVCLKMVSTPKPNGFADHYISLLNGYFIGNINPTFSDKPMYFCHLLSFQQVQRVARDVGTPAIASNSLLSAGRFFSETVAAVKREHSAPDISVMKYHVNIMGI